MQHQTTWRCIAFLFFMFLFIMSCEDSYGVTVGREDRPAINDAGNDSGSDAGADTGPTPDTDPDSATDTEADSGTPQQGTCDSPYRCGSAEKMIEGYRRKFKLEKCDPTTGVWTLAHDCSETSCRCNNVVDAPSGGNFAECAWAREICDDIRYTW